MPLYRVKENKLDEQIATCEQAGEIVTQVMCDPATVDGFMIVTRVPVNDTGRAWLPSNYGKTETRS